MKTGNTDFHDDGHDYLLLPQWSPVMKTGNTGKPSVYVRGGGRPQWSPVMKTGNTFRPRRHGPAAGRLNGARS